MILDSLDNADVYHSLNSGFEQAFDFLRRPDLANLEDGTYEIEGKRVYALLAHSAGRPREEGRLEVHRKYIDVQYVMSGTDEMGWRPLSTCSQPQDAYNAEDDFQLFDDPATAWVAAGPGSFTIFFPGDPHIPLISTGQLHKAVVKVTVD